MAVMGVLVIVGLVLVVRFGAAEYVPDEPTSLGEAALGAPVDVRPVAVRYLRGVAAGLVGGFWTGALITGPAIRLIMRLLAVTAGDDAQGRVTEAEEVVGDISLGGTIGLYIFGGLLIGVVSGVLYILVRRWLPGGRLGGVAFGVLLLLIFATRADPLRPDNPDFDLVGPGWLGVLTFGLATIVHGVAVASIANRYSALLHAGGSDARARRWVVGPLVPPALLLGLVFPVLILLAVGLGATVVASQVPPMMRAVRAAS